MRVGSNPFTTYGHPGPDGHTRAARSTTATLCGCRAATSLSSAFIRVVLLVIGVGRAAFLRRGRFQKCRHVRIVRRTQNVWRWGLGQEDDPGPGREELLDAPVYSIQHDRFPFGGSRLEDLAPVWSADHDRAVLVGASPHNEARTVTFDRQGFGTIGLTLALVGGRLSVSRRDRSGPACRSRPRIPRRRRSRTSSHRKGRRPGGRKQGARGRVADQKHGLTLRIGLVRRMRTAGGVLGPQTPRPHSLRVKGRRSPFGLSPGPRGRRWAGVPRRSSRRGWRRSGTRP